MVKRFSRSLSALTAFLIMAMVIAVSPPVFSVSAEEVQTIVTEYDDLWTGNITVKVGVPVKWYVNVPTGTEPKGCRATIKIPDLGWGTDTHNKDEGHLVLTEGENFVYEFTPEETGDILFCCWMGSGCHKNYIHVVDDTTEPNDDSTVDPDSEQTDSSSSADDDPSKTDDTSSKADSDNSTDEIQEIVTEYEDLWTGNITVKVGVPVKWYVNVPAGTEPKGCRAAIKIPDLGWGTDTHNKDEGHLVLTEGENFVYEFTPEETGDILFCCWMGSGCHKNYIHVVDDTTEPNDDSTVDPDSEQTDGISADDDPSKTDDTSSKTDDTSSKTDDTSSKTDDTSSKTDDTSSKTDDTSSKTDDTSSKTDDTSSKTDDTSSKTDDTSSKTDDTSSKTDDTSSKTDETSSKTDETSSKADSDNSTDEIQEIITEYDDLWTGNITVKVGVPVKWYVNVPAGTVLMGCERTIKIPGLGWGTDSHNKNEGHLTLEEGKNFVYEFTPEETGDILFTCWMGSACHYNYIHVTSDGIADPNAEKGGKRTDTDIGSSENSGVSTSENKKTVNSAANTSNPNTGDNSPLVFMITAIISASVAVAAKKNMKHDV